MQTFLQSKFVPLFFSTLFIFAFNMTSVGARPHGVDTYGEVKADMKSVKQRIGKQEELLSRIKGKIVTLEQRVGEKNQDYQR